MDRAIGGSGGGAVAQEFIEEMYRDAFGMGRLDELALLREGVGVQPFQEVGSIGADDLHLRKVDMRIDETGQDEVRTMVDFLDAFGRVRLDGRVSTDGSDHTVFDQKAAIFLIEVARPVIQTFGHARWKERRRPLSRRAVIRLPFRRWRSHTRR